MKEFFNLLGWKDLIVVFLVMVLVRISIIIPFYSQWYLPPSISWESFLIFTFGICFLFAGNNIAIRFYEEKRKILLQSNTSIINIKEYPDVVRFRGLWIVLWFVGLVASGYSCFKISGNYYYTILVILILFIGYVYANYLRQTFLLGNIALAILYSAVILSQLPHDSSTLIPYTYKFPNNWAFSYNELIILFVFLAGLVFALTLLRDMTGDIVNIEQDSKMKYHTIGVKLGERNSKLIMYILSIAFMVITAVFLYFYKTKLDSIQLIITFAIIIIPIIYYMIMLQRAKMQTEYNYLYIFLGMLYISILFVISFCKHLFINGSIQ